MSMSDSAAAAADAQLSQLVQLYRVVAAAGTDVDADATECSKGFALVAAIGVERMKALLAERLASQAASGQSAYQDHEFLDALQAVFWALHAPSNAQEGEHWRKSVFAAVVQSMHAQNAPNALASAILNVLLRELHHLHVRDLPLVVDELLRGFVLCQQLQRVRPAEGLVVFYSIELLPQLLLRVAQCPMFTFDDSSSAPCSGAEFRDRVLTKLFALAWPPRFFLQVLKTFRDFAFAPAHERALCVKLVREIHRELPDESDGLQVAGGHHSRRHSATSDCVESLPTVFYTVVLLIGRLKTPLCKRVLLHLLLRKCGAVARTSAASYADQRSAQDDDDDSSSNSASTASRSVRVLLSTLVYHVDLVLKHDASLATVFLTEYELRSTALTAFDIGLLLTVAAAVDKCASRVNALLVARVVQSYDAETPSLLALHTDAAGVATRSAFLDTIVHPQDGSWSPVTQRMVAFGFALLVHRPSASGSSSASRQQANTADATAPSPPWVDFAIRIVLACFAHHVAAREAIVDHVVNAIVVQDSGSTAAITLLARIVKRHPLELTHKLAERLHECLEYVTHMSLASARLLFAALSPLLQVRPHIKSFVVLTLRKAMFRKDEASRTIAIAGFAHLLCLSSTIFRRSATLTQLYSQNTSTLLSQGVGATQLIASDLATQEHANAVVAEDLYRQFCGIFKRALQLQTRVRLVLYAELDRVFHACPTLRPSILDLAFQHYAKYYDANESILPPLKLDACLARARGTYEEPLGYLLHVLLLCVRATGDDALLAESDGEDDDDVPATQTAGAQKAFAAVATNVAVLMERMKRSELGDFDIDKNLSFAPQTALGQSNQRLARTLLDVWEVCMNWTIQSIASADTTRAGRRRNGNDDDNGDDSDDIRKHRAEDAAWTALVHYLDMHKWLQTRLKESEERESGLGANGERKRGRPAGKVKLKAAGGASTSSNAVTADPHASSARVDDYAPFFAQHASFSSALLVAPASVLALLDVCKRKLEHNNAALARDDGHVLLFALEKAARVVAFAQQSAQTSATQLFRLKTASSVLVGERRVVIDRLGSLAFAIFYTCDRMSTSSSSTTTKRSPRDAAPSSSLIDDVRVDALKVFSLVARVWMTKSSDDAADCLAQALASVGAQDEDELLGDGATSKLENCAAVLHALVDAVVTRGAAKEALLLLDVIARVWRKLPVRVLATYELWMKRVLLKSAGASAKVLEALVQLFLRPHPDHGLLASFALQLANGLLHYCNGGDSGSSGELPSDEVAAAASDRMRLDRFDEKSILTCATAVLARCEDATSALEPRVKDFDAQQRRQSMKLTEDDVALLETLEDETGAAVLDLATSTATIHAQYKAICRELFELCGILLPFVMMDLNRVAVSIRVIRLIGRLYKLLVVMVTSKLRRKDASLPKYLQRLFDRVASELSPTLLQFIACIHEEGKRAVLASASKTRAKANASSAQSKLIPDVIFQMEQFDVALIKLSKLSNDRVFDQWIRLRQSRDFRFNREIIKERIDDDGDDDKRRRDDDDGAVDDAGDAVETETADDETQDERDGEEEDEDESVQAKRRRRQLSDDAE